MNQREVKELRLLVKLVSNNLPGVTVVHLPGFYCFALELAAARDRMQGEDLEQFARVLVEKYVRRQLRREHLEAIAFQVFDVVPAKEPKLPDPTDPFGFKAASARAERLGRR